MRISKISSVRTTTRSMKTSELSIKDIVGMKNLPKLEPVATIKPLSNPFDDEKDEQDEEDEQGNQDDGIASTPKYGRHFDAKI